MIKKEAVTLALLTAASTNPLLAAPKTIKVDQAGVTAGVETDCIANKRYEGLSSKTAARARRFFTDVTMPLVEELERAEAQLRNAYGHYDRQSGYRRSEEERMRLQAQHRATRDAINARLKERIDGFVASVAESEQFDARLAVSYVYRVSPPSAPSRARP